MVEINAMRKSGTGNLELSRSLRAVLVDCTTCDVESHVIIKVLHEICQNGNTLFSGDVQSVVIIREKLRRLSIAITVCFGRIYMSSGPKRDIIHLYFWNFIYIVINGNHNTGMLKIKKRYLNF